MAEVKIREARREDMLDVLQMIRELATYNSKPIDQIKMDHMTLERDGFDSPSPAFRCFLAERTNASTQEKPRTVGYAMFFTSYTAWYGKAIFLEDLFVRQEFRKCGAGKKLFLEVAKVAKELSCRMDFHVRTWNTPSIEFYRRMGSVCLTDTEDLNVYSLANGELRKALERL